MAGFSYSGVHRGSPGVEVMEALWKRYGSALEARCGARANAGANPVPVPVRHGDGAVQVRSAWNDADLAIALEHGVLQLTDELDAVHERRALAGNLRDGRLPGLGELAPRLRSASSTRRRLTSTSATPA
jgi:hypothetical protein